MKLDAMFAGTAKASDGSEELSGAEVPVGLPAGGGSAPDRRSRLIF